MEVILQLAQAGRDFGVFAAVLWIAFEVRDMRRWFKTHLEIHHKVEVA